MLIIILASLTFLLTLAYVSPIIARKIFPAPINDDISIMVSFPHGLQAGQNIQVEGEVLKVINVDAGHLTLRKETTV